jgi:hypoxanthine phosphoribosyltransferase
MSESLERLEEARKVLSTADCLHTEVHVQSALDAMALDIGQVYAELNPVLLCVMNGGLVPAGELMKRLEFPFEFDYLHATRYRGRTTGRELFWQRRPAPELITDRHVLVIDDILDEGHTLAAIRAELNALYPRSLRVAVLVEKRHDRRAPGAEAEFVGLEVEDRYVFGCGMDYKEYWRQLPAVYAVKGL